MTPELPALLPPEAIRVRLLELFPEGTASRSKLTSAIAASVVFTALYVGAISNTPIRFGPKQVYRMTQEQSLRIADTDRKAYLSNSSRPGFQVDGARWYQDNTREVIRDDTIRLGLRKLGLIFEEPNVSTTAAVPRYALDHEFAALFDPALVGEELEIAISDFRAKRLNPSSIAAITLAAASRAQTDQGVLVTFPSGETRRLAAGASSLISKQVIEVFATNFLKQPALIWLSESRAKVVQRDMDLANAIGLDIRADKDLPDIILADIADGGVLIVFVEVVATDGPIDQGRKEALLRSMSGSGIDITNVRFVTAYAHREHTAVRKTIGTLAWDTFAWIASEPECLVIFRSTNPDKVGGLGPVETLRA